MLCMSYGFLSSERPTVCNTSLLRILFNINTVKTISPISAAAEFEERKGWEEDVLLMSV